MEKFGARSSFRCRGNSLPERVLSSAVFFLFPEALFGFASPLQHLRAMRRNSLKLGLRMSGTAGGPRLPWPCLDRPTNTYMVAQTALRCCGSS